MMQLCRRLSDAESDKASLEATVAAQREEAARLKETLAQSAQELDTSRGTAQQLERLHRGACGGRAPASAARACALQR